MRHIFVIIFCFLAALPRVAAAQNLNVVTDIAPVGALVETVLGDHGGVTVLLPPDASPHHFSLRPSQARALQNADAVIWIGAELSPWLDRSIVSLAPNAVSVSLLHLPATEVLSIREDVIFDDHGDHSDHSDHDDHDHDHADGSARIDPHAWLSPKNASVWLAVIAQELSTLDPSHAADFVKNANAAAMKINIIAAEIAQQLAPVRHLPFLLSHDGTQYFEHAFDLTAQASISNVAGDAPSVQRLTTLGDQLQKAPVSCLLQDYEAGGKAVILPDGSTPTRVGTLRSMGQGLPMGGDLYGAMLRDLADSFVACLTP